MARITRKTQKIFSGSANADQIAVFGTMKTGTPQYSTNLDNLQSAEFVQGWANAILEDKAPYLEEMNGVQYGITKQLAYIFQQGLSIEYDANTTYYKGSIACVISGTDVTFYKSLTDDNKGNSVTDGINWELHSISTLPDIVSNLQAIVNVLQPAVTALENNTVKLTGAQTIAGTKTFVTAPQIPNSAAIGSSVSTSGISKGVNGYVKFGNGIIIQWGSFTHASGNGSVTVTLPTAMSSKNSYKVAVCFDTGRDHTGSISAKTTTTFTFKSESYTSTGTTEYIVVGY